MDVATLARAQAVNRIAIGAGMTLFPGLFGRVWAGGALSDKRARVLGRAVGARDLTLGLGGVLAQRDGDREWARRSFAAQALADTVDLLAILGAGDSLSRPVRLVGGSLAAGSAAVAAAYARELAN
jgi:hypothetical protein